MIMLSGQTAIIVGGGGQVGFSCAQSLSELGVKVIILARSHIEKLNAEVQKLKNYSELKHYVVQVDITKPSEIRAAVDVISAREKCCDILINCAGYSKAIKPSNLHELSDEMINEILKINLMGPLTVIREFEKLIRQSQNGIIVNLASVAGVRSGQSNLVYSAAKAGLISLTQNLALTFAPQVRVVSVSPGYLEHPTSGIMKAPEFNRIQSEKIPLKRVAQGQEIAEAITAIIQHFRYSTGTNFVVDGGRII